MFRNAYAIARQFTQPVMLSRRSNEGKCASSIGAYVVINDQGWIVTAAHIIKQFVALVRGEQDARRIDAEIDSIRQDTSISRNEQRRRLSGLGKRSKSDTSRGSAWWGRDDVRVNEAYIVDAVDLAVAKLEPFDPSWISTYPVFKDPTKDFHCGTSLCKLGFPFHAVEPKWNDEKQRFELPPGSLPFPLFPIEGILTRMVNIKVRGPTASPFPLRMVETSTPGLKGKAAGRHSTYRAPSGLFSRVRSTFRSDSTHPCRTQRAVKGNISF